MASQNDVIFVVIHFNKYLKCEARNFNLDVLITSNVELSCSLVKICKKGKNSNQNYKIRLLRKRFTEH